MKTKIKTYFRSKGFYDYRRGWDKGTCLYCGSEDKAGVNVGRDFYHCFVCEEKGKLPKVIMEIEEIPSFMKMVSFLNKLSSSEYESYDKKVTRIEAPVSVLPEGYINIRRGEGEIADRARDYILTKRKIRIETAAKEGLGYVPNTDSKYFGRIIIPFKRNGKVVYFQARSFLSFEPKIMNPGVDETGVGKSQVIFNEEALNKYKEVDVVESVFNALTLAPSAIGLNGKVASSWQLSRLQESTFPTLYNIILDNDAWEYAKKLAIELIKFRPIRLVRLGSLDNPLDVNDLGKEEVLRIKSNCPILSSNRELRAYIKQQDESYNKQRRVRILI